MDILERLKELSAYRFIGAKTISDAIDEIARLRVDAERQEKVKQDYIDLYKSAAALVLRLEKEVKALRMDAERYRWLRDNSSHCWFDYKKKPSLVYTGNMDIDAAIDAARAKGESHD